MTRRSPAVGRVLHVSKFPPSPSGIALYADTFSRALQLLGGVERIRAAPEPGQTQRLTQAIRGLALGLTAGRRKPTAAFVELGGRSLFEFHFAVGAALARIPLFITCHDAPSLVGQSFLFTGLDRKGLRRLGEALSKFPGGALERMVVRRAMAVLCLTRAGAVALEERYDRRVVPIPHVVDDPELLPKERLVFVPGYVSSTNLIVATVREIGRLADQLKNWRVVVGACPTGVQADVLAQLTSDQARLVTFAGSIEERALLNLFARAAVVLRLRGPGGSPNDCAASGPLAWAIARGCICVTDDKRAGASELAEEGFVQYSPDPVALLESILTEFPSPRGLEIAQRAQEQFGVQVVAEVLSGIIPMDLSS